MLRAARPADTARVRGLLSDAGLGAADVPDGVDCLCVCEVEGAVVGVGALELHGRSALLRSLAVCAAHRGRGVASRLCDRLEAEAGRGGADQVFLLTETAARFFARRGYAALDRADAPPRIAASAQFARLCPASATFMWRVVDSVPTHPYAEAEQRGFS